MQLYRVAASGGEAPELVSAPGQTAVGRFVLGTRGDRVVYADSDEQGVLEIFLSFLAGVRRAGGTDVPSVTR